MARIQTPQHVQELQAEFKVREPFGLELLETIQPTYSLGRQKIASTGYPRRCFGTIAAAAGGVGTNIECSIRCPANVGILTLVESFSVVSIADGIQLRMDDGVAMTPITSAVATKAFQDSRLSANLPESVLEIANPLTAAANGTRVGNYETVLDNTVEFPLDVVLGGDGYILIRTSAANAALTVNWVWTEFLLEDR